MAGASKNSRTTVATQKFACPDCGGEIVMKTLYEAGYVFEEINSPKEHYIRIQKEENDFA